MHFIVTQAFGDYERGDRIDGDAMADLSPDHAAHVVRVDTPDTDQALADPPAPAKAPKQAASPTDASATAS